VQSQLAESGYGLDDIVGLETRIVASLSQKAYAPNYLAFGVEYPQEPALTNLGLADADEWYAYIETWLKSIEAQVPDVSIVLCSYIKGNSATETGATSDDRDRVQTLCTDNGWDFVDLYACPHSQVWTGASPGTYGFYDDSIHPSDEGQQILAERFASYRPHPTATAPYADPDNPPTISGTETVGQTLSVTNGTWNNSPTGYTYQWLNNLTEISGATSSTYTLQASDEGDRIACRVTATKTSDDSASFTAAPTGVIAAA